VFGADKSIVRVRNWSLHELLRKLTKGIAFVDWKTKWEWYDLRISIHGPEHLQDLAEDIEHGFYSRGRQKELVKEILALDPNAVIIWGSVERFEKQLEKLETEKENREKQLDFLTKQAQELNLGYNKEMD
jgi:Asp-tRNA(Asn)/Glu-tRNA(Gln) amidotransferase B subunit